MRYALAINYNGARYCGWQRQNHSLAVQQVVETALTKVADEPIKVICAGRTDTGVHALAQIAHFDTMVVRPDKAWTFGTNTHLDKDVSVHWVGQVSDTFHARFSALTRSYRYSILNRTNRSGYMAEYASWECHPLDLEKMRQASSHLLGKHDFSSFRSASCQAPHAMREIYSLTLGQSGDLVTLDIVGNAFLHNMVRIVVGSLMKVGLGERPPEWIAELLAARDRTQAGVTAPACGLTFLQPTYPSEFGIPVFKGQG